MSEVCLQKVGTASVQGFDSDANATNVKSIGCDRIRALREYYFVPPSDLTKACQKIIAPWLLEVIETVKPDLPKVFFYKKQKQAGKLVLSSLFN
ncbi:MAG: hypothetical protein AAGG55_17370 [Pseudomonadota bacterium]